MESTPRDKTLAIVVAVAVHAVILLSFCFTFLTWPPSDDDSDRLPDDEAEILLVSDYINLGDMLTPQKPADAPKNQSEGETLTDATDLDNGGEQGTPAQMVVSKQPSPMKVKEKPAPEKKGPTKEELEKQEKEKREKAARDKIKSQMNFGGKGNGEGISGTDSGNAVSGSPEGSAGHDLAGRTIVSWGKNRSTKTGSVRISVVVNPKGEVVSAKYGGGTGAAAGDEAIRSRTIAAAKATRFSALPDGSRDQKGTITWNFK